MRTLLLLLSLLVACDDGPATTPTPDAAPLDAGIALDATPLDATAPDAITADASPVDAALPDASPPPGPTDYCEATVDLFCPYYLRCGRMAVDDLEGCREAFLSNCNGVYEPVYAALAEAGLLALSAEGVAACGAHLEAVPCEAQIFDLDGPCAAMWQGQAPAGGTCAPGIESFVCAPGTTCVLGLDFCGTCEPVTPIGGDCSDVRCGPDGTCVADRCEARSRPGQACGVAGCVVGARCDNGTCAGPARAALGEPCDRTRGCPYKSACVGGVCVQAALIGEACDARPCAGGWCDGGVCVAPGGEGEACSGGAACVGQICTEAGCAAIPGPCFTE